MIQYKIHHLRCINVKWGFVYYFDIMLLTSVLGEREKLELLSRALRRARRGSLLNIKTRLKKI